MSTTYATLPSVLVTAGPTWATMINSMFIGDPSSGAVGLYAHRHEGTDEVKIRPAGMTIDAALTMNTHALTNAAYLGLVTGGVSPVANSLYTSGGDLYYYSGIGSAIKITAQTTLNGGGVANGFLGQYEVSGAADYESADSSFSFYNTHSAYTDANLALGRWGSLQVKAPGAYAAALPYFVLTQGASNTGGWAQYSPSNTAWALAFDVTSAGTYADVALKAQLANAGDSPSANVYDFIQNGVTVAPALGSHKWTVGGTYTTASFKPSLALVVAGPAGVASTHGPLMTFGATNSASAVARQAGIRSYWQTATAGSEKGALQFLGELGGPVMLTLDNGTDTATFHGTATAPHLIGSTDLSTPSIISGTNLTIHPTGYLAITATSVQPTSDAVYDLGTTSLRWNNTYTALLRTDSTTRTPTDLRQRNAANNVLAWAMVTQSGTTYTIQDQYNISTVGYLGVGDTRPNFSVAVSGGNYAVIVTPQKTNTMVNVSNQIGSRFEVQMWDRATGNAVESGYSVVVLGAP